jgi:CBS-domain-containing membrane protein
MRARVITRVRHTIGAVRVSIVFITMLIAIGAIADHFWTIAVWMPLVNSLALVEMLPDSESARPRAIAIGYFTSAMAGTATALVLGSSPVAAAMAAGASVFLMVIFRAIHPPAAATALLLTLHPVSVTDGLVPIIAGALLVSAVTASRQRVRRWMHRCVNDGAARGPG